MDLLISTLQIHAHLAQFAQNPQTLNSYEFYNQNRKLEKWIADWLQLKTKTLQPSSLRKPKDIKQRTQKEDMTDSP
jgi:hypothetical protein